MIERPENDANVKYPHGREGRAHAPPALHVVVIALIAPIE